MELMFFDLRKYSYLDTGYIVQVIAIYGECNEMIIIMKQPSINQLIIIISKFTT